MKRFVYECPDKRDAVSLFTNVLGKKPVYVVEPFHTYHHKKGIRFFPPPLPFWVEGLVADGQVRMIKAEDLKAQEIYPLSADRAVSVVDKVFPAYRKRLEKLIFLVSSSLKSPKAEDAFKITLCNNLAEFYSTNILLHRVQQLLGKGPICFSPSMNVSLYAFIRELLSETGQDFYHRDSVSFSLISRFTGTATNIKDNLFLVLKLGAQALASGFLKPACGNAEKKQFRFGISIIGSRQLRDNQRSPDFMLGDMPRDSKVVYFPIVPLSGAQEQKLRKLSGEICPVPRPGKLFSNFTDWRNLFILGIRHHLTKTPDELYTAALTLYNYFAWSHILKACSIKHFITHADFGVPQIGRNTALHQSGAQTWYFTDSMNHGCNFQNTETRGRHPFWTYLNYDHFVTWTPALASYYKSHPGTFRQTHVVGCLWSEHIRAKDEARRDSAFSGFLKSEASFVIACYDSTYTRNGVTNYSEGLEYAGQLFRLVEETPDIYLIIKEKKDRAIHFTLDPVAGPKLMELYNRMSEHPRIHFCSNQVDASEIISVSDLVLSFPFTSTTFEALCNNRPAIWHDAAGNYRESIFGKIAGLVTHDYEELKSRVTEIMMKTKQGRDCNDIPDSPYMDPFHDGRAIERFRDLLSVL